MIGDQDSISWRQYRFLKSLWQQDDREYNDRVDHWMMQMTMTGARHTIESCIESLKLKGKWHE